LEEVPEEPAEDLEVAEAEDRPLKPRMTSSDRMKWARLGLGLQYAKFLCNIGSLVLTGLTAIVGSIAPDGVLVLVLRGLNMPLSLGTTLLGLGGALLCFWVPKKSRARGLIVFSFALDAGAVVAVSVGLVLMLVGGMVGALAGGLLVGLGALATLGACLLFILFVRALAFYLGDKGSGNEGMEILVRWIIMMVLAPFVLSPVAGLAVVSGKSIAGAICALVFFAGFALTWLTFYIRTLLRLLDLIATVRQKIASRYDLD
jgi:hypothetical protein